MFLLQSDGAPYSRLFTNFLMLGFTFNAACLLMLLLAYSYFFKICLHNLGFSKKMLFLFYQKPACLSIPCVVSAEQRLPAGAFS